jgi:hypothetical protein
MALMRLQLLQLREALAIARVLGRALVLPRMRCSCELAFGPGACARPARERGV